MASITVYSKSNLDTALAGKVGVDDTGHIDADIIPDLSGTYASSADLATEVAQNTLTVLAPQATGTDQLAALQSAANSAATLGLTLALNGDHVINGQLALLSGSKVDGTRGSITQTANLTPAFNLASVSGIRLRNLTLKGKTTDWVNSSSVHGASAVHLMGVTDIRIDDCAFTGWAGDGVFVNTGCSDVHINRAVLTGPGPTYLTAITNSYGGGVNVQPGVTNWSVTFCDISGFAQGINTGDNMADIRIVGNLIHDIPSQHGMYIETVNGGVIANNIVRNTGLLGMKIQIGTTGANDPDSVVINGNAFINAGDAGILLTRPQAGPGIVRRVIVSSNVITGTGADGITVDNADSLSLVNNIVTNAGRSGIRVTASTDFDITGGRVDGCGWDGIRLDNVQDWIVSGVRVKNPASLDAPSDEFGIKILTASSADGTVRDCKITDANAHMRYGIYVNTGDQTSMGFIDNIVTGATDYGWRGIAANARAFRGNRFAGGSGAILTAPSNFTSKADLAAAPTAADLNAVLAVLRQNGLLGA